MSPHLLRSPWPSSAPAAWAARPRGSRAPGGQRPGRPGRAARSPRSRRPAAGGGSPACPARWPPCCTRPWPWPLAPVSRVSGLGSRVSFPLWGSPVTTPRPRFSCSPAPRGSLSCFRFHFLLLLSSVSFLQLKRSVDDSDRFLKGFLPPQATLQGGNRDKGGPFVSCDFLFFRQL